MSMAMVVRDVIFNIIVLVMCRHLYKLSRTVGIIYVYTTKLQDGCTRANLEQCKDIAAFYQDGTCGDENFNITTECMLLPSKEERDWSKWKAINTRFNPQSVKKVLNPI